MTLPGHGGAWRGRRPKASRDQPKSRLRRVQRRTQPQQRPAQLRPKRLLPRKSAAPNLNRERILPKVWGLVTCNERKPCFHLLFRQMSSEDPSKAFSGMSSEAVSGHSCTLPKCLRLAARFQTRVHTLVTPASWAASRASLMLLTDVLFAFCLQRLDVALHAAKPGDPLVCVRIKTIFGLNIRLQLNGAALRTICQSVCKCRSELAPVLRGETQFLTAFSSNAS